MKLRNNKGIGLSDTIIAIAVFMLFSGVMITISYNIYLQSNFIKRNDTATNYVVEALEFAKKESLEKTDVEIYEDIEDYISDKYENMEFVEHTPTDSEIGKGYTMYIQVTDIHDLEEYEEEGYEANILKKVEVSVYYNFSGKVRQVSMNTLIKK